MLTEEFSVLSCASLVRLVHAAYTEKRNGGQHGSEHKAPSSFNAPCHH